jgi:hypothetical protein
VTTPAFQADGLTRIELIWHQQRIEHWIRFGRDVGEQILDRRRRVLSFAPNSIVAYVRWASGDFGTIVSRIDVLRTVRRGEPFSTVPYVRPGGEILLRVSGWARVERVLQAIEPSSSSASTRQTPALIIGDRCTTALSQAKCRGRTAARSTKPGSCAKESTHDAMRLDRNDMLCDAVGRNAGALSPRPATDLERQRQ